MESLAQSNGIPVDNFNEESASSDVETSRTKEFIDISEMRSLGSPQFVDVNLDGPLLSPNDSPRSSSSLNGSSSENKSPPQIHYFDDVDIPPKRSKTDENDPDPPYILNLSRDPMLSSSYSFISNSFNNYDDSLISSSHHSLLTDQDDPNDLCTILKSENSILDDIVMIV